MAQPGRTPGCAYRMEKEKGKLHIRQSNGKWEVVDSSGDVLGRYDSKPAAEAHSHR